MLVFLLSDLAFLDFFVFLGGSCIFLFCFVYSVFALVFFLSDLAHSFSEIFILFVCFLFCFVYSVLRVFFVRFAFLSASFVFFFFFIYVRFALLFVRFGSP